MAGKHNIEIYRPEKLISTFDKIIISNEIIITALFKVHSKNKVVKSNIAINPEAGLHSLMYTRICAYTNISAPSKREIRSLRRFISISSQIMI